MTQTLIRERELSRASCLRGDTDTGHWELGEKRREARWGARLLYRSAPALAELFSQLGCMSSAEPRAWGPIAEFGKLAGRSPGPAKPQDSSSSSLAHVRLQAAGWPPVSGSDRVPGASQGGSSFFPSVSWGCVTSHDSGKRSHGLVLFDNPSGYFCCPGKSVFF